MHSAVAVAVLSVLAIGELIAARHDRVVPPRGAGSLARINPGSPDPAMWRWAPGVGPVLAGRLASAAGAGLIHAPGDVQRVPGIGPIMAERLRGCVRWETPP
jgi:hypothetical protein